MAFALSSLRASSGSPLWLNIANFLVRLFQAILAATVIGLHASEYKLFEKVTLYYVDKNKIILAVAAGSLSLLTAIPFAILPFVFSYSVIAVACAWDWILFFVWIATYAQLKEAFPWGKQHFEYTGNNSDTAPPDFRKMQDAVWIDLVNMLLWLITALMGVVMLLLGRGLGSRNKSVV